MAVLVLACLIAMGVTLRAAWHATQAREATLPELETMARRSPLDGRVLALLGARQAQADDYAAAAGSLRRAVLAGDDGSDVWLAWAAAAAAAGDLQAASDALQAGARNPEVAPAVAAAAERCRTLGPSPPGASLANAICPQGPQALIRSHTRGSFLNSLITWWGRRHPEDSGSATREAWARPDDAQAQRLWGEALMRDRRYREAEAPLRRAVALAPNSPLAHLALGDLLTRQGYTAKGALEYTQCLRLRRDWLPALLGVGRFALDSQLVPIALDKFQRATRAAPNSADAWAGLGRAYYSTRIQYGQSLTAFQTAMRLAPERTDFYLDYFKALHAASRFDEAEAIARRRLAVAPRDAQVRYLLGLLLTEHDATPAREAEAEAQLRESLRLAPHVAATDLQLAQILVRQHNYPEAVRLLQDALADDPLDLQAMRVLARAYQQAGQTVLAQRMFARASYWAATVTRTQELEDRLHVNPVDLAIHEQLIGLYTLQGKTAEANREREYAYYLKHDPRHAIQAIRHLSAATTLTAPIAKDSR